MKNEPFKIAVIGDAASNWFHDLLRRLVGAEDGQLQFDDRNIQKLRSIDKKSQVLALTLIPIHFVLTKTNMLPSYLNCYNPDCFLICFKPTEGTEQQDETEQQEEIKQLIKSKLTKKPSDIDYPFLLYINQKKENVILDNEHICAITQNPTKKEIDTLREQMLVLCKKRREEILHHQLAKQKQEQEQKQAKAEQIINNILDDSEKSNLLIGPLRLMFIGYCMIFAKFANRKNSLIDSLKIVPHLFFALLTVGIYPIIKGISTIKKHRGPAGFFPCCHKQRHKQHNALTSTSEGLHLTTTPTTHNPSVN